MAKHNLSVVDVPDDELPRLCEGLLEQLGEDPSREGLLKTPMRYARALRELTQGYQQQVDEIINGAVFAEEYSEMIVVKRIEFYSLCEHHLLPFFGHAHVAYVPNGKILGLSKIPRIINMFARRLQVQERITEQVTKTLNEVLQPLGVACMIEGYHMCMMMRGVQSQSSTMVTNSMSGVFLKNPETRDEFLKIINAPRILP